MNNSHYCDTKEESIDDLSHHILRRIKERTHGGEIFRIALSGGSTPVPLYKALGQEKEINWDNVELFLVDERYVSFENEYSNKKMIEEMFIKHLEGSPKKWVFFNTELPAKQALQDYERQLDPTNKEFFDLVILGMGTDGHTASLFPGDILLQEEERWVGKSEMGNPIAKRLTLTYPAIRSSKEIVILIKGEEKEGVVSDALLNSINYPIGKILAMPQAKVVRLQDA